MQMSVSLVDIESRRCSRVLWILSHADVGETCGY